MFVLLVYTTIRMWRVKVKEKDSAQHSCWKYTHTNIYERMCGDFLVSCSNKDVFAEKNNGKRKVDYSY